MKNAAKLAYILIAVALTATVCSYYNQIGMINFYYSLQFPPLVPPSIAFSSVWTLIYALMIGGAFIVSLKADANNLKNSNFWFLGQLILQILWTYTYFYLGAIGAAAIIILLLDYNVYKMIRSFAATDKTAAYLQYPYMLWVLFATYLNFGFVYYNGTFVM